MSIDELKTKLNEVNAKTKSLNNYAKKIDIMFEQSTNNMALITKIINKQQVDMKAVVEMLPVKRIIKNVEQFISDNEKEQLTNMCDENNQHPVCKGYISSEPLEHIYKPLYSKSTEHPKKILYNIKQGTLHCISVYNTVVEKTNGVRDIYTKLITVTVNEFKSGYLLESRDELSKLYEIVNNAKTSGVLYNSYYNSLGIFDRFDRVFDLTKYDPNLSEEECNFDVFVNILKSITDSKKTLSSLAGGVRHEDETVSNIAKSIIQYNNFLTILHNQVIQYYKYFNAIMEIQNRYVYHHVYLVYVMSFNGIYCTTTKLTFPMCRYYYWIIRKILDKINNPENKYFNVFHYITLIVLERCLRYYAISMLSAISTGQSHVDRQKAIVDNINEENKHATLHHAFLKKLVEENTILSKQDKEGKDIVYMRPAYVEINDAKILALFNHFRLILDKWTCMNYPYSIIVTSRYISQSYPVFQDKLEEKNDQQSFSVKWWLLDNNVSIWVQPQDYTKSTGNGHVLKSLELIKNIELDLPYDDCSVFFFMYDLDCTMKYNGLVDLNKEDMKHYNISIFNNVISKKYVTSDEKELQLLKPSNVHTLVMSDSEDEAFGLSFFVRVLQWRIMINETTSKIIRVLIPIITTNNDYLRIIDALEEVDDIKKTLGPSVSSDELQQKIDEVKEKKREEVRDVLMPEWRLYGTQITKTALMSLSWNKANRFEFLKWLNSYILNEKMTPTPVSDLNILASEMKTKTKPDDDSMWKLRAVPSVIKPILDMYDAFDNKILTKQDVGEMWFVYRSFY